MGIYHLGLKLQVARADIRFLRLTIKTSQQQYKTHTTSKTLLESIRTMIARLAVFAVILGIALAQSPPPKPCPGIPDCIKYRKAARSGGKLNWV